MRSVDLTVAYSRPQMKKSACAATTPTTWSAGSWTEIDESEKVRITIKDGRV